MMGRTIDLRRLALFFIAMIPLLLASCGQSTDGRVPASSGATENFSVSVPQALQKLTANGDLTAQLIVDGTRTDLTVEDTKVSGSIAAIPKGEQTFVIEYFLDGILIASAETVATVLEDGNVTVTFTSDSITFKGGQWNDMGWNANTWS